MKDKNIDLLLENQSLKNEFIIRGLDLSQVFNESPDDLECENRSLCHLLDWVNKYLEYGNRKKMEVLGYNFPPIEPAFSPDNDWYLFERWMEGKSTRNTLRKQLHPQYIPKDPQKLNDDEIFMETEKLKNILSTINFSVDLKEGMPARLVYQHLIETLDDEFSLMQGGFWHLDGCTGYCPDCIQRPWCEGGCQSCWDEDEEAGEMFVAEPLKKYLSASPVSLQLLRDYQAKHDKEMEKAIKLNDVITDQPTCPPQSEIDDDFDVPF